MLELNKKQIKKRLQKLRNFEMLHPRARKTIQLLEEQLVLYKEENKLLKEINTRQDSVIEKLQLRVEELERMVFGRKNKKKDNDINQDKHSGEQKDKKPRHPSTYRRSTPKEEDITETNDYPLGDCPDCGTPLEKIKWVVRYQEDIKLFEQLLKRIEKQRIQTGFCPHCHKRASSIPISSQTVSLGGNIRQFVCYCVVVLNLSFEKTKHLIKDLADIQISDGEISNILEKQAQTLLPQYHKLKENIRAGPASNYDETGWRVQKECQGKYGWVMAGANTTDTVFSLGQSRGRGNAEKLKGDTQEQVGISDDYGAYRNLFKYHQLCWAHPIRKLKDLASSEQLPANKHQQCLKAYQSLSELHQNLKLVLEQPFNVTERQEIKHEMIKQLIKIAKSNSNDPVKLINIKQALIKNQEKYFTCLLHQGVPTTNNRAERALRHLVLKRKSSFGSKTQKGAWTMSILCSVLLSLWWSKPDNFFKEYSGLLNSS